jgi:hypothetical protein
MAAQSQPFGPGHMGWNFEMRGPGMMGGFGYGRMCSPDAAGFADWRMKDLERTLELTDPQRELFDVFKKAASGATEIIHESCPLDFAVTAPARMEAMEKRMDAMLRALKIVRPAFDALYAALTDEQKSVFDRDRRVRRGWYR